MPSPPWGIFPRGVGFSSDPSARNRPRPKRRIQQPRRGRWSTFSGADLDRRLRVPFRSPNKAQTLADFGHAKRYGNE